MAVIWGLDLHDMQWYKFKGSYMFNGAYHLQTTKMIVYQLAMILCVVSESIGTAALSDYVDQQSGIQSRSPIPVQVHNNSYIGIASYNIFVGIAVATIFGSGFFFDLFWPERVESPSVKLAWKMSAVLVSFAALADSIAMTVIVATQRVTISGVSFEQGEELFRGNGKPNPVYRRNAYCVASCVVLWPGMVFSFVSAYIMWISINHNKIHGPKSSKFRGETSKESVENGNKEGVAS